MPAEHVFSIYDWIVILIALLLCVTIIILDFLFCSYYSGGICPVRWFFTLIGTFIYDNVANPAAKLIIYGVVRLADLIPL